MSIRGIANITGASVGTVHNDQVFNSEHLAGEGMSTRAIAPIVGVDYSTVSRDRQVLQDATPARDLGAVKNFTPASALSASAHEGGYRWTATRMHDWLQPVDTLPALRHDEAMTDNNALKAGLYALLGHDTGAIRRELDDLHNMPSAADVDELRATLHAMLREQA